jgi:protein gp37
MNKTNIEYCDMTFNPVTGCLHGCSYCYARDLVRRFQGYDHGGEITTFNPHDGPAVLGNPLTITSKYGKTRRAAFPYGFDPTLHMYRLDEPKEQKKPQNIFVCSMADLFGEWVPDGWIQAVFDACAAAPQHRYLFLTKNPKRLTEWIDEHRMEWCKHQNSFVLDVAKPYYGVTITCGEDLNRALEMPYVCNRFWSIEPLLDVLPWDLVKYAAATRQPDWIIIGAETGNRKGKIKPERDWVENIVSVARDADIPVFMKNSIAPYWDGALVT